MANDHEPNSCFAEAVDRPCFPWWILEKEPCHASTAIAAQKDVGSAARLGTGDLSTEVSE